MINNFTILQLQTNSMTTCINNALDTINTFKTGYELTALS